MERAKGRTLHKWRQRGGILGELLVGKVERSARGGEEKGGPFSGGAQRSSYLIGGWGMYGEVGRAMRYQEGGNYG